MIKQAILNEADFGGRHVCGCFMASMSFFQLPGRFTDICLTSSKVKFLDCRDVGQYRVFISSRNFSLQICIDMSDVRELVWSTLNIFSKIFGDSINLINFS